MKMASTETGSVALMNDPKAKDSLSENSISDVILEVNQNIMLLENMARKVPMKENIMIVPMFLKNGLFCKLYPLSKIIGGRRSNMNRLTKCLFSLLS